MLHDPAQLDLMFQALADPARRQMVDRLSRGPASVSQLAEPLAMSLSAVVQHLNVLEASGLVRSEKRGRVRTCQIALLNGDIAEHNQGPTAAEMITHGPPIGQALFYQEFCFGHTLVARANKA